jgi:hypothetical protein
MVAFPFNTTKSEFYGLCLFVSPVLKFSRVTGGLKENSWYAVIPMVSNIMLISNGQERICTTV